MLSQIKHFRQRMIKYLEKYKVVNTALFGIFGTKRHKTFHCDDCSYEW
jgi:hypothetical protein